MAGCIFIEGALESLSPNLRDRAKEVEDFLRGVYAISLERYNLVCPMHTHVEAEYREQVCMHESDSCELRGPLREALEYRLVQDREQLCLPLLEELKFPTSKEDRNLRGLVLNHNYLIHVLLGKLKG